MKKMKDFKSMYHIRSIAMTLIAAVVLVGCSTTKQPEVEQGSVTDLYNKAEVFFKDANYKEALKYFDAINSRFPYGSYAQQSALDAIYAAYRAQDYTKALSLSEAYLRGYSQGAHLDYVLYITGLANMALADNFVQDAFKVDQATRDVSSLLSAYQSFNLLQQNFPTSMYVADAQLRMKYIIETVARHQLYIVKFYQKRKAYVAVINRALALLRQYPETEAAYQVLPILINAYQAIHIPNLAERFEQILQANKNPKFEKIPRPTSSPKIEVPKIF
ncbi:outer membrane protein assembly factor BamD [Mergibacter septicus]|nr:outer membrane protein assembly factor BamD [Mergibacter septicus]